MVSIASVILKTVVRKFYERNSGFFLFIFFLMFGIVESTQIVTYHLSLIYGLLNSPVFLSIACLAWILYIAKCFSFVLEFFSLNENNFLHRLLLLSYKQRLGWLMIIFFFIDLPVIVYVSLIVAVAMKQPLFVQASFIILFHLTLILIASILFDRSINSLTPAKLKWPSVQFNRPIPFSTFHLTELFHKHKLIFIITKLFSFISLIGFVNIPLDHYEYRTALMGLLFGIAAHAMIVFEFRKMEESHMPFLRNLPLSFLHRFIQIALVYSLLLVPEGILLIVNHTPLFIAAGIYLFGVGLLTLSHCRLYIELDNDKHIQWTLALFLISFMLVLFKVYLIELILIWLLAFYFFRMHFYQFESSSD